MIICLHQRTPLQVAQDNGHTTVVERLKVSTQLIWFTYHLSNNLVFHTYAIAVEVLSWALIPCIHKSMQQMIQDKSLRAEFVRRECAFSYTSVYNAYETHFFAFSPHIWSPSLYVGNFCLIKHSVVLGMLLVFSSWGVVNVCTHKITSLICRLLPTFIGQGTNLTKSSSGTTYDASWFDASLLSINTSAANFS